MRSKLPSVHADHLLPLSAGGAPYAMDNLRGSCVPCHELKTALENTGNTPAEVEAHRQAATPLPVAQLMGRTGRAVIP